MLFYETGPSKERHLVSSDADNLRITKSDTGPKRQSVWWFQMVILIFPQRFVSTIPEGI